MTVIITGGRSGLGKSISEYFACNSRRVVSISLDKRLEQPISRRNYGYISQYCVREMNENIFEILFNELELVHGEELLIINNLNVLVKASLLEMSLADWHDSLTIGLNSAFLTCKFALMRERKSTEVTIINISSISSTENLSRGISYGPAKAALNKFSLELANEFRADNVRTTNLILGAVNTRNESDWKLRSIDVIHTIEFIENLPNNTQVESITLRPNVWPA